MSPEDAALLEAWSRTERRFLTLALRHAMPWLAGALLALAGSVLLAWSGEKGPAWLALAAALILLFSGGLAWARARARWTRVRALLGRLAADRLPVGA